MVRLFAAVNVKRWQFTNYRFSRLHWPLNRLTIDHKRTLHRQFSGIRGKVQAGDCKIALVWIGTVQRLSKYRNRVAGVNLLQGHEGTHDKAHVCCGLQDLCQRGNSCRAGTAIGAKCITYSPIG